MLYLETALTKSSKVDAARVGARVAVSASLLEKADMIAVKVIGG